MRLIKLFIGCLIVVALLMMFVPAFASGDDTNVECIGNSCNSNTTDRSVNVPVSTGGNTIEGSKALALGNSLGDVDINACRESSQWGTPLFSKQKVQLNKWCAADWYDSVGKHDTAARMRCSIQEVVSLFGDADTCYEANLLFEAAPAAAPTATSEDREHEILEDEHHLYQAQIDEQAMAYAQLAEELEQVKSRPQQVIERTVVQEKPLLTDEQRAALTEVLNE